MRLSFAQSTATKTRSEMSSGHRRRRSASGMNAYSPGSGASPYSTMMESLPSWSKASFAASRDPSASPSGFSCVVRRKRSCPRIASATALRSLAVVWGELIDQLGHADPPLHRRIVLELQLGGSLHSELSRNLRLKHGMCRLETGERLRALPLGAEHRHVDPRVPQIGRGLDAGDGDESDPRVLELAHRL